MKFIFHIDLNAFFASVEEILNPELKNHPIAVASVHGRGVVGSPNYLAREYGVKSAMSTYMAKMLCPDLVLVRHNHEHYEAYSQQFFHYLRTHFSTKIEIKSIDECFIDFSSQIKSIQEAHLLAKTIQVAIQKELNLSVNIGISDNKFNAKILSNLNKPMGINSCFGLKQFQKIIWPLPIENFLFIGAKKLQVLRDLKIATIGDFANFSDQKLLQKIFLNQHAEFLMNAWNQGDDFVDDSEHPVKSISKSMTLFEPSIEYDYIKNQLYKLAKSLWYRLENEQMIAKNLVLSVKYNYDEILNFSNKDYHNQIESFEDLYITTIWLFDQHDLLAKPIIFLGIQLKNLQSSINLISIYDALEQKNNDPEMIITKVNQLTKKKLPLKLAKK